MQIVGARSPLCGAFRTDGFWELIRVRKTSLSMMRINLVIANITNMEKSTDNADQTVHFLGPVLILAVFTLILGSLCQLRAFIDQF